MDQGLLKGRRREKRRGGRRVLMRVALAELIALAWRREKRGFPEPACLFGAVGGRRRRSRRIRKNSVF